MYNYSGVNNINKQIDFAKNSFRFIANDRRLAENTPENQNLYQVEVQKALAEVYSASEVEYDNISIENERLAFTVRFKTNIDMLDKN